MIVYKLFCLPIVGKYIKKIILKLENGEKESKTLRNVFRRKFNIDVGMFSYGCFEPKFNIGGSVKVGRYCSIAGDVHFFGANHPIDYACSSAYFYNKSFGYDVRDVARHSLDIGNDVWIGYGSYILSGCNTIGNGAVIGAGSVVTHDVPPYAVVAGNPAKIIKMRFSENEISELEASQWWTLSPKELMKFYKLIDKPRDFANAVMKYKKGKLYE